MAGPARVSAILRMVDFPVQLFDSGAYGCVSFPGVLGGGLVLVDVYAQGAQEEKQLAFKQIGAKIRGWAV